MANPTISALSGFEAASACLTVWHFLGIVYRFFLEIVTPSSSVSETLDKFRIPKLSINANFLSSSIFLSPPPLQTLSQQYGLLYMEDISSGLHLSFLEYIYFSL